MFPNLRFDINSKHADIEIRQKCHFFGVNCINVYTSEPKVHFRGRILKNVKKDQRIWARSILELHGCWLYNANLRYGNMRLVQKSSNRTENAFISWGNEWYIKQYIRTIIKIPCERALNNSQWLVWKKSSNRMRSSACCWLYARMHTMIFRISNMIIFMLSCYYLPPTLLLILLLLPLLILLSLFFSLSFCVSTKFEYINMKSNRIK